ncbi:cupin domain-containing protein [Novosphingobium album (ex Liu et al. 2023)]|uniref:Cupin domain-containing protein n=1 Tax=Novosphingobium album (ex Liu et al. 2023) TaxID=3031130 RepID=A0ABT5WVL6_9SPHN|nr:cupin domain-containing protein [Novosphingobium album (ex Liu et al. 2023)]MDE8653943.1 cupin domain-containing protein [Novosphingobium album (ex Liu et al. 2023)]
MPKLDLDAIPSANATGYPAPFDQAVAGRWYKRLAPASGLGEMGASHVTLKPGAWSSQRHWHNDEDELLIMLAGEAVLIEDAGEDHDGRTVLRAGDVCAWPKGVRRGHHLVNESDADCVFVAISAGNRNGTGGYADIDMTFTGEGYFRRDGTPYPTRRLR